MVPQPMATPHVVVRVAAGEAVADGGAPTTSARMKRRRVSRAPRPESRPLARLRVPMRASRPARRSSSRQRTLPYQGAPGQPRRSGRDGRALRPPTQRRRPLRPRARAPLPPMSAPRSQPPPRDPIPRALGRGGAAAVRAERNPRRLERAKARQRRRPTPPPSAHAVEGRAEPQQPLLPLTVLPTPNGRERAPRKERRLKDPPRASLISLAASGSDSSRRARRREASGRSLPAADRLRPRPAESNLPPAG